MTILLHLLKRLNETNKNCIGVTGFDMCVCYMHIQHFQRFEFVDGPSSTKKDRYAKHTATCVSDAVADKRLSPISSAG